MREETVRLTRQQLYDLVWSRPMTAIAADFGMSSVAFAKYCKELDVPRPGRGYWRQLASGQKPSRDKLPEAKTTLPEFVVIEKYERPSLGRRPPQHAPRVVIPERVNRYHPVAKELDELARPDRHHQGMLAVRGERQVVLKIGEGSRRRVLRLLHTLFHAVEERGYEVRLDKQAERSTWGRGRRSLVIVIDGAMIEMSLREHLNRTDHQKSENDRRNAWFSRKYDLHASGNLIFELHIPWGTDTRTRWRDGEKGRLEDFLGQILWAIEQAARGLVVDRSRLAEQARLAEIARKAAEERERERQRRAEEERQQRERDARDAAHQKALHDDLVRMANEWQQADVVRAFLAALTAKVPQAERTPDFSAWLDWAEEHAKAIDPLTEPQGIARPLTGPLKSV
jgi:hypothetical protein